MQLIDPIAIAHRQVKETRQIVEQLVTSSESFDYPKAKAALQDLQKKLRELSALEAELAGEVPPPPSDRILPFPASSRS